MNFLREYTRSFTFRSRLNLTKKGFSLLEILVVLCLIALVSGLVASNFDNLIRSFEKKELSSYLFEALREGRYQAGRLKESCLVSYDKDSASFKLSTQTNLEFEAIPTKKSSDSTRVEFYPINPDSQINGKYDPSTSNTSVSHIIITPSGLSSPISVQIEENSEQEDIVLDIFSSAPITELLPDES